MADDFKEKLQGIGFLSKRGGTKTTPVTNELDGSVAGQQVEHWDGRVDGVATPPTLELKLAKKGEQ